MCVRVHVRVRVRVDVYVTAVNVFCNFVLDGLWPVELAWGFLGKQ